MPKLGDHPKGHHRYVKDPALFIAERRGIARFNHQLALKLGDVLGSMTFFYFCVLLDLIELPPVIKAHDVIIWVTYVAQTVIQLIALPILQVYQNIIQTHANAKAKADRLALTHIAHGIDELLARKKR